MGCFSSYTPQYRFCCSSNNILVKWKSHKWEINIGEEVCVGEIEDSLMSEVREPAGNIEESLTTDELLSAVFLTTFDTFSSTKLSVTFVYLLPIVRL